MDTTNLSILISICVGVGKKIQPHTNHILYSMSMVYKSLELIYNEDLN